MSGSSRFDSSDENLDESDRIRLLAAELTRLEKHGWSPLHVNGTDVLVERIVPRHAIFLLRKPRHHPREDGHRDNAVAVLLMWVVAGDDGRIHRLKLEPRLREPEYHLFNSTPRVPRDRSLRSRSPRPGSREVA